MSIDLRSIALSIIDRNPNIARDPKNAEMIATLRSGDATRGQQMANDICGRVGKTPEEAQAEARNFFHM